MLFILRSPSHTSRSGIQKKPEPITSVAITESEHTDLTLAMRGTRFVRIRRNIPRMCFTILKVLDLIRIDYITCVSTHVTRQFKLV